MFNDRNLLVTGGTGSIGSSICDYFKKTVANIYFQQLQT